MATKTVRGSRLSYYSSVFMMLLGAFTFLFVDWFVGLILIVVGYLMYRFYRRQRTRSLAIAESSAGSAPVVVREKETQVVVRIPCKHCGVLNDQLRTKCESCGAPLK